MNNQADQKENIRKLGEMIKEIKFAMLTTAEPDGTLRSRPMATQATEFNGELWFFTAASAPKVEEIEQDHHVNLSYAAPDKNLYVSVSGKARMVRDRKKAEELWNPAYKAWFPKGLDDPDLALLRVGVTQAEYWDSSSSAVVHLVGFVKALATGERYHPGENEKMDLR